MFWSLIPTLYWDPNKKITMCVIAHAEKAADGFVLL